MSTALVLGNGNLLINLDEKLNLTDFYWPHVGQENHLARTCNELFLFYNNQASDLASSDWQISFDYAHDSLVANSKFVNEKLQLEIHFQDTVLSDRDIFLRLIKVKNLSNTACNLKLIFKHNFQILENNVGDTAIWYPYVNLMCHYKKDRYIGVGTSQNFYQYNAAGPLDNAGQGSIPDVSGELAFNAVATGTVQSCVSYQFDVAPSEEANTDYFIVVGRSFADLENEARYVRLKGSLHLLNTVQLYWKNWVRSKTDNFFDHRFPRIFFNYRDNEAMIELYKKSLLIVRTHMDNQGAVIASTDTTMLKAGGTDSYAYFWPRDGAMTVLALIEVGFGDLVKSFFHYLAKVINRDGYILHKYYADSDSGLASSWHPWVDQQGKIQLPIQEDETALALYALWKHNQRFADQEFLNQMWGKLVLPAANFLVNYRFGTGAKIMALEEDIRYQEIGSLDEQYASSGLPLPSYDLWEQARGINLFTVAAVYAGLKAASNLAEVAGHNEEQQRFSSVADQIKQSVEKHMYDADSHSFINRIYLDPVTKTCIFDKQLDSSISALWKFEMFAVDDPRIEKVMDQIAKNLWVKTKIGGIARKEADHYFQVVKHNPAIPGNPWFISTLWLAQYWLEKNNIQQARVYLEWVLKHADKTGLMAEQADPLSGFGISVKPLIWSQAEYIHTINLLKKLA
ncbi:MAG: glycoside hydrolase family 15 protein [bacterium]